MLEQTTTTGPADGTELFIPNDEKCLEYLERIRWANGVYCPYCRSRIIRKHTPYRRENVEVQRYMCLDPKCGKTFTVLTGTIFSHRKLGLGEMFYVI